MAINRYLARGRLLFALFLGLAILGVFGLVFPANAQPPATSTVYPNLPVIPTKPARPVKGPESISSFIESVSANDAMFEVVLGQGRILNLKEDLAVAKKTALVA